MVTTIQVFDNRKVKFNAVLEHLFSDTPAGGSGGAQALNVTGNGFTITDSALVNATIYLLFIDGVQYTAVDIFSDPVKKEFTFDNTTGVVTVSVSMTAVPVTIFYVSPGTAGIPGVEPVTLTDAKAYCKIDTGTEEDTLITQLIVTAREQCEDFTGISFVSRTVTAVLNNSCGGIFLPYCPFASLISIQDQDGNTIEITQYQLSGEQFPQLVYPRLDRMKLVYIAGYGFAPSRLKTAILQQVFYLYTNRGETAAVTRTGVIDLTLSPQAKATLQRLRRAG